MEFLICSDQGWSYEGDWQQLSHRERASWIAFYNVRSRRKEAAVEAAKSGA